MTSGHNHSSGGPCHDLLGQLSDYIDGEMEAALCAELEAHLVDCPDCRVMVDTVRKTVTLYSSQATTELPSEVQNRLYKVLKLED
ncbi:MAG TPA: zf-HC2 domain-containing protein [Anaerolineae bacterium]|nr:zf-HC2 domain-containing protein [Anaerolineae bacterium]